MRYELIQTREGRWHVCGDFAKSISSHSSLFEALRAMRTLQHLPTCHDFLVDQGVYVWTHYPEDVGDEGDGESGPMPYYHPAWDEYAGDYERLIFVNGALVQREPIDFAMEAFFAEQEKEQVR